MSGSKGKAPATHPSAHAEADEPGDTFESISFLEDANALLEKVKGTAENVTTCQVGALSSLHRGVLDKHVESPGMKSRTINSTVRY